ncbi:NAD-dependent epimerase/dehydratase family protein (plasmid) [Telmatobacter bradus]|uniref:NAD-dependent epimerase/dehydratase family protein n=1 Tax=Telmatobacter bradus TaxID=474953 RepID=UPI003B42B26A
MSEDKEHKKILLTGGSGTLGYNILRRLADDPRYSVAAPVRDIHSSVVQKFAGQVQFIEHDLSDAIHTAQIFERLNPDIIVHCAASGLRPPRGSWFDLMQFNVVSTMRLFQMNCRLDKYSHFIYVSTGLVYREQARPLAEEDAIETLHPYGASKAATDLMLQAASAEFKRRLTILRPFAFTGQHDGGKRLFPLILEAAAEGRKLGLTAGTQIRDFCAVDDIAEAVSKVIERDKSQLIDIFNLGSGLSHSLRHIIEMVCNELELKVDLAFGESKMHSYEPHNLVANISRAESVLGWKPEVSLPFAVWELAQEIAPNLKLKCPGRKFEQL